MPFDQTTGATTTYQGFTYDDLAAHYNYDPVGGKITSTHSGLVVGCKGGTFNRRVPGRGQVKFSAPMVAMILYEGFIADGLKVKVLDKDKSNLKFTNLMTIDQDTPVGQTHCKPTTKEGVVEHIVCGYFVVRGGDTDGLFFTPTLEEAVSVRDLFLSTGILPKHEEWPFWPDFVVKSRKRYSL